MPPAEEEPPPPIFPVMVDAARLNDLLVLAADEDTRAEVVLEDEDGAPIKDGFRSKREIVLVPDVAFVDVDFVLALEEVPAAPARLDGRTMDPNSDTPSAGSAGVLDEADLPTSEPYIEGRARNAVEPVAAVVVVAEEREEGLIDEEDALVVDEGRGRAWTDVVPLLANPDP